MYDILQLFCKVNNIFLEQIQKSIFKLQKPALIYFNLKSDEGKIRPLLDPKSFSFSQVAAAHDYAESGQAIGKVTLKQSFDFRF